MATRFSVTTPEKSNEPSMPGSLGKIRPSPADQQTPEPNKAAPVVIPVPFPFGDDAILEIALASITDRENQSSKFVDHTHRQALRHL
jgi:hypothetical protein